ncbi:MAG TPA: ribonuclease BN, partial [Gammaproteobacteria bacterium]|nr:ribonuclease BN [Gammaproteobacteria bacterium]
MLYVLVRDLARGQLSLRAASLSYTTLLSLVPLLAVSFSVLQAFGVYNQLEPLLLQFLEPLGPKGAEIGERIVSFVSNMRVGVLGSVGLAMLFYTVISLVNKIERSFNHIWRVKENRTFGRR